MNQRPAGHLPLISVIVVAAVVGVLVAGCGGGDSGVFYLTVFERPSWGPGAFIAVAALGADGNPYIWIVNEGGGGARLLTPSPTRAGEPAGGAHPAYSPDGTTIAFSGRRDQTTIIYTMNALRGESAGLTAVTEANPAVAGNGSDRQPSWSPDGTLILYSSNRPDGNYDIWQVNVNTRQRLEVVGDPGGTGTEDRWPVFDPTGTGRIAFEAHDPATGNSDIWIREPDGTLVRVVGDGAETFGDGAPWWSNDGQSIYFHSNRGGDWDIWRVDLATGQLTQLTNTAHQDGFPVTEPNGDRIAFVRGNEVWSMAQDGTNLKRITRVFQ